MYGNAALTGVFKEWSQKNILYKLYVYTYLFVNFNGGWLDFNQTTLAWI